MMRHTHIIHDMTIDSGWVRVFKEQAPDAFCQACPFRPKVAYIDGMPLLMIAESRTTQWKDFLSNNFARCVLYCIFEPICLVGF